MTKSVEETVEQIEHWILTGQRFGYPTCCIRSFTKMLHLKNEWPNPWSGTGYVPCVSCARKPMLTIQGAINYYRDPSLPPFPSAKV